MEIVRRHAHDAEEVPNLGARHVAQRVVLDKTASAPFQSLEYRVDFNDRNTLPRTGALVLALPRDPSAEPGQLLAQRFHLADAAALLVAVLVEREQALFPDQFHHLLRIWKCVLYLDAVMLLDGVEQLIRLGVQPPGVQGEDAIRAPGQVSVLDQGHVLGTTECDGYISFERGQGVVHDHQR